MNRYACPSCEAAIVKASGPTDSKVLVIGEFPGTNEIAKGVPFATHYRFVTAGKVFRKELERVGLSLGQFRVTNLWLHEPNKNDNCYQVGYDWTLDEAKGKSAILLVGSEVVEAFTRHKVGDVAGLQVDSPILSAPIIYAMPNPALAFHKGIGEIRLSLEKWSKRLELEGLV